MEKRIKVKSDYNSLEAINKLVKDESNFESKIDYDSWDIRTDSNGQMEKCVLIKKSNMHGMKVHIENDTLVMSYLIPNKVMNAYFGRSVKIRRNILEIVAGGIKNALLSGSQKNGLCRNGKNCC